MLFYPLANISFKLVPEGVFREASKMMQHGVLTEFSFQTALHGIKFCTSLAFSICCCSGVKFSQTQQIPTLLALPQIQLNLFCLEDFDLIFKFANSISVELCFY